MDEYKIRYPSDRQRQDAYEEACDCLTAGDGIYFWNACGLVGIPKMIVWNMALRDMGKI